MNCELVQALDFTKVIEKQAKFGTFYHFQIPKPHQKALKTFSAGSMKSNRKNETLFAKIQACNWSPDSF